MLIVRNAKVKVKKFRVLTLISSKKLFNFFILTKFSKVLKNVFLI